MSIQYEQKSLLQNQNQKTSESRRIKRSGTFTDNMKLPIHRWFRYSAGFSAEWVINEILNFRSKKTIKVLDPFAGSATTLISAESVNVKSVGFEPHPFIFRVAKAKLGWNVNTKNLRQKYKEIISIASNRVKESELISVKLLQKCFTVESLNKLDALKTTYLKDYDNGSSENELIWLGITSIIRLCSTAGTAQWQYVLPNKKKANVREPFEAFSLKMEQIIEDISYAKYHGWSSKAEIIKTDIRNPDCNYEQYFDLIITSPPYPNNYDYADATRLEMTFWGEIKTWGDLHSSIRQYLLCSCSQHSAKEKLQLDDLLNNTILNPIRDEITYACRELEKIRLTKGGKKTYHTMAAAYFSDLGKSFQSLRKLCKDGGQMCFVIGDSAPYGVYLAADKWLGELALASGFKSYYFEKLRDRNIKWKNRTHTVPLHEGRLWIKG